MGLCSLGAFGGFSGFVPTGFPCYGPGLFSRGAVAPVLFPGAPRGAGAFSAHPEGKSSPTTGSAYLGTSCRASGTGTLQCH